MTREKQFEILEYMFTWKVVEKGHFTMAFYAHYKILNDLLECCAKRFEELNIPRYDYMIYAEYIYSIYSELCITLECLLKSILEENGMAEDKIKKKKHNLQKLINAVEELNTEKAITVASTLRKHQKVLDYFVSYNVFVNSRYMTYEDEISLQHINMIKELIIDLDNIFVRYYSEVDWFNILYPDSMVSD